MRSLNFIPRKCGLRLLPAAVAMLLAFPLASSAGDAKAGEKSTLTGTPPAAAVPEKTDAAPKLGECVDSVVIIWGKGKARVYSREVGDLEEILPLVEKWIAAPKEAVDVDAQKSPPMRQLMRQADNVGYWVFIQCKAKDAETDTDKSKTKPPKKGAAAEEKARPAAKLPAGVYPQTLIFLERKTDEIFYGDADAPRKSVKNDTGLSKTLEQKFGTSFEPGERIPPPPPPPPPPPEKPAEKPAKPDDAKPANVPAVPIGPPPAEPKGEKK
jgi:hypothetical protein